MTKIKLNPKLLVLAPYPQKENLNDGFIQRVNKMDEFMVGVKRIYLHISLRSFFKKREVLINNEVGYIQLNLIWHFFLIMRIALTVKLIYAHTIYNLRWISYFFHKIKSPIILDVHGTVPEEKYMNGQKSRAKKFNEIENKCFRKISTAIFVTESMNKHFHEKYPSYDYSSIIYGIIPGHLTKENINVDKSKLIELKEKLQIFEEDTVVIYSGGLHVWQNIDLMLSTIESKKNDKNIVYIFLVSNKQQMKEKMANYNFNDKRIILDSVHPDELKYYYALSNYGFVLRDDDVVNKVANPTKLIEYLFYNIIPIVKLEEIGDFIHYGYEYLRVEDYIQNNLHPIKSKTNLNVVNRIFDSYNKENIVNLFKSLKSK